MKLDKDKGILEIDDVSVKVIITDIKMSFFSMIVFMVKWAIATIPAFIILVFIAAAFSGFITGFVRGLQGL